MMNGTMMKEAKEQVKNIQSNMDVKAAMKEAKSLYKASK